jgi:hypothetical protein
MRSRRCDGCSRLWTSRLGVVERISNKHAYGFLYVRCSICCKLGTCTFSGNITDASCVLLVYSYAGSHTICCSVVVVVGLVRARAHGIHLLVRAEPPTSPQAEHVLVPHVRIQCRESRLDFLCAVPSAAALVGGRYDNGRTSSVMAEMRWMRRGGGRAASSRGAWSTTTPRRPAWPSDSRAGAT